MSKRTIIIFSVFISVAMISSAFIYLYRAGSEELINRYISKIVSCGEIQKEDECFSYDFCVGIYKPSCPDCNDVTFSSCERLSFGTVAEIEKERNLCEATNGKWYRNKLGNFCFCQPDKKFNKAIGCIKK
jgi:hypothetical protein